MSYVTPARLGQFKGLQDTFNEGKFALINHTHDTVEKATDADTATKATQDADGNVISETYIKVADAPNYFDTNRVDFAAADWTLNNGVYTLDTGKSYILDVYTLADDGKYHNTATSVYKSTTCILVSTTAFAGFYTYSTTVVLETRTDKDGNDINDTYATNVNVANLLSNKADKATTIAGYGITDAKIVDGTITLGSATITPLTSANVATELTNTKVPKAEASDTATTATSATKATQDGNGNVISSTYVKTVNNVAPTNGNVSITIPTIQDTYNSSSSNGMSGKAVSSALSSYAPLNSPTFTGAPKAPTPAIATNDTQIATAAFVHSIVPASKGDTSTPVYVKSNGVVEVCSKSFSDYLALAGGTLTGVLTQQSNTVLQNSDITFGTAPTADSFRQIAFVDGAETVTTLGNIRNTYKSTGNNEITISATGKDSTNTEVHNVLTIGVTSDGKNYVKCNSSSTMTDLATENYVATTKWVSDKISTGSASETYTVSGLAANTVTDTKGAGISLAKGTWMITFTVNFGSSATTGVREVAVSTNTTNLAAIPQSYVRCGAAPSGATSLVSSCVHEMSSTANVYFLVRSSVALTGDIKCYIRAIQLIH